MSADFWIGYALGALVVLVLFATSVRRGLTK